MQVSGAQQMSGSFGQVAAATESEGKYGAAFWEFLWRTSGISFIGLLIVAYLIYGSQPQIGASAGELSAFYVSNRTWILIASFIAAQNVLNLLWFAAGVRATLADVGKDGWGAAVTTSSTAVGVMFFLLIMIPAALAYSIAGSGNQALTSGLNDLVWAGFVMTSFPRAMLIMAPTFGLWRAGLMSNGLFAIGVGAVVLTLAGGTTWMSDGVWAPDGIFSRFISPIIGLVWIVVVTRIIVKQKSGTRGGW